MSEIHKMSIRIARGKINWINLGKSVVLYKKYSDLIG